MIQPSIHTDPPHLGHHLPHADFIIVLGNNGKVLEQGSYAQLRSHAGGYIHTLGMQSIQTDRLAETLDISEKDHQSQNTATGSLSAPSATHVTRQANDLAVYKYYFSSLGGLRVSMLLLFLIVNAGIDGFRCTSQPSLESSIIVLCDLLFYRRLGGHMVLES